MQHNIYKKQKGKRLNIDIGILQKFLVTVCPINSNAEIQMSKDNFERLCIMYHSRSYDTLCAIGYCTKTKNLVFPCKKCPIGKAVKGKNEYDPPKGVVFNDFTELKELKELKEK